MSELRSWISYAEEDYSAAKSLLALNVQARDPESQPRLEETKEAIEIAKTVRRFARSFLGLKK